MNRILFSVLLGVSMYGRSADLQKTRFSNETQTPSPAVIAASPYGDVFVGLDLQGSLGKKINMGSIKRLRDNDNDGVAEEVSHYVSVDNPRGIVSIGNKLIVLHCTQKDGKVYGQDISVFTDANDDGVADGPGKVLVKGIGNPKFIQSRGADHCTNNIRLGIDGWLYISVGDFGFVDAEGTDGKKLTCYGGGVARVRPDGTELEMFIHGTRNVYDVAIDPFMNVFSRENTNDGVGWWVRFTHYIQSGEYGYPCLYKNFIDEMIPALGMYGGGSGTGALFLQEPSWPAKYNNKALMADWGRSQIIIHEVTPDGPSFTNEPKKFLEVPQVADLDVDASGRMYVAAWAGAGYQGSSSKGYVERYVPVGWQYKEFPSLTKNSNDQLLDLINSESATARVYAQQEILRRNDTSMSNDLIKLAYSANTLEARVAAVYTLAQLAKASAFPALEKLAKDPLLREHAIRLLGDRKSFNQSANIKVVVQYLNDSNPRVRVAASVALGRMNNVAAAKELLAMAIAPKSKAAPKDENADQVSKFTSEKVDPNNSLVDIEFDISEFKSLTLTIDSLDWDTGDHAAWVNPVVVLKNGKEIDLTKVKWQEAKGSWGKTLVNKDCQGNALQNLKGEALKGIGTHATSNIVYTLPQDAVTFKAQGTITKGASSSASFKFIVSEKIKKEGPVKSGTKCSNPNPDMIVPHVARQALVNLGAHDLVIDALNSGDSKLQKSALGVMKFMHHKKVIDALEGAYNQANSQLKKDIISTLMRLQQKDVDWDGSTWWSTRPDPTGPYFEPSNWEQSTRIAGIIKLHLASLSASEKAVALKAVEKNRCNLDGKVKVADAKPKKLGDIKIADSAIEDIVIYIDKNKGDAKKGAQIINTVGCISCHNTAPGMTVKGPDLSKLSHLSKADLAESIIKPGASIAKSWVNLSLKDGSVYMGTIVKESKSEIILHNIAGVPRKIATSQVEKRESGLNMMSVHLTDGLSLQQFTDLIAYLQSFSEK
ncbi:DUF7133 domain-containing protein [Lentisphaera araneosa]|nr:HEAT repeat domain-containing protein [Lentisphaera araneosa]